ncbi:MAG: zinc ribbon domain-containing protein [Thermoplasmata archaeon]|nr:zinc ribbon domain-containing protein [Thermoplasmata archaeon]
MMRPLARPLILAAVLVAFLSAGFVGIGTGTSPVTFSAAPAPGHAPTSHLGVHPAVGLPQATRGDLIVGPSNSPLVLTPATVGANTYFQEGNVTVLSGGTLLVRNLTFSMVQFVGSAGNVGQRLAHIYSISIQGKAVFTNSILTTDLNVLNPYPKLNLNVTGGGSLTLQSSSFQFPGSVTVTGAGSLLWMNASTLQSNPGFTAPPVVWNRTIYHDSLYAPTLTIGGGAHAVVDRSGILQTYRDNATANGFPQAPFPLSNSTAQTVTNARSATFGHFALPADPENLTKADLYNAITGGSVQLLYSTAVASTAPVTLNFGAANYPLGTAAFSGSGSQVTLDFTAAAVQGINAAGWNAFLQATGDFGATSQVNVVVGTSSSATPVNISFVTIQTAPTVNENITVSGAGSVLTAADSLFDLNYNLSRVVPWGSNKVILSNGAQAFLANLSLTSSWLTTFHNDSTIVPDATSTVAFYRWAQIPVSASVGIPIPGAQATAFYAYSVAQANNATATALNTLGTADPDLATYVATWDKLDHVASYGLSDFQGHANLLLASSTLTQSTLPDGTFVGNYHIAVTVAALTKNATQWVYGSVAPYPHSMAPGSPDVSPPFAYPGYLASIGVSQIAVSAVGEPAGAAMVAIGSALTVSALITNTGTAQIAIYTANLSYKLPAPLVAKPVAPTLFYTALAPGASKSVNLTWVVNESITGTHGKFLATFLLTASWNGGVGPNAGVATFLVPVTILPSPISISLTPPQGTFIVGHDYFANGAVTFNGKGAAFVNITATGPGGSYVLNAIQAPNGTFTAGISPLPTMGSGTYTLVVTASYNTAMVWQNFTNFYVIPGPTTTQGPFAFLTNTLFGIPIWVFLVIAAIGVGAIVAALFVLGRTAKGKLVECGECGELIPENATVCPKCGAEFETDLVRCSRCSSTIPANSKVCPECSAQLLGKAEGAGADPEQQGYADFIERYRAEARKELGDNYNEGAFWDWWKRQATYVSFSQWRLQQGQGTRAGMAAPPGGEPTSDEPVAATPMPPRRGGGAGGAATTPPASSSTTRAPPPAARAAPVARPASTSAPLPVTPAASPPGAPATAAGPAMKACTNCGKEIPPDYLVCPFCGAVTR